MVYNYVIAYKFHIIAFTKLGLEWFMNQLNKQRFTRLAVVGYAGDVDTAAVAATQVLRLFSLFNMRGAHYVIFLNIKFNTY
ncbi:hypothetical protein D5b_00215 [Faustovirus]|nr:hypothetical protein D5b_00215 [Faustovirus]AMN84699.1 hypothetical protein D6_00296 [Faustovirus]AMP44169.1 hypothetical protein PRJ_Dakar_00213 [Faustovirus]